MTRLPVESLSVSLPRGADRANAIENVSLSVAAGEILCVVGESGSGKSVIASNLAVLLAQRSEKPVVLVDADLQFGDVAVMLKLTPQHTIVDAVSSLDRMDATMLRELLVEHQPEGLLVLPAPLEPAFADQIGASEMVRIVETRPPTSTTWSSGSSRSATTCSSSPAWTSRTSRT